MHLLFVAHLFGFIGLSSAKTYRSDYVYVKKTDAFYKFHVESESYGRAISVCEVEGSKLMIPKNDEDLSTAHNFFKEYPDIVNYVWVGNDGFDHDSGEDGPIIEFDDGERSQNRKCDTLSRDGNVATTHCVLTLPFVCKVNANDAVYDAHCSVYGDDYKYYANVNSCYKIPKIAYSWNQAYSYCRAEGAHLLVLNSELESEVVKNLTHNSHYITNAKNSWFFHVGIRGEPAKDGLPVAFKTIFNQTLEEAGFNKWSENEPNNYDGKEYCGTIFKTNGKYNDVDCSDYFGFVCENEVVK